MFRSGLALLLLFPAAHAQQNLPDSEFFALDATTPNPVLYSVSSNLVYRSSDNGATWTTLYLGEPDLAPPDITSLATDPLTPGTVYVGMNATDGGVWRTTDAGVSWRRAVSGLPDSGAVTQLVVSESPRAVYALIGQNIYKSADGGANWTRQSTIPVAPTAIDILPKNPASMAYSGLRDVYRSADEGRTWIPAGSLPWDGSSDWWTSVTDVALDPRDPSTVYAAYRGRHYEVSAIYKCNGNCYANQRQERNSSAVTIDGTGKMYITGGESNEFCVVAPGGTPDCVVDRTIFKLRLGRGPNEIYSPAGTRQRSLDGGRTWIKYAGTFRPTLGRPAAQLRLSLPYGTGGTAAVQVRLLDSTVHMAFTAAVSPSWLSLDAASGETAKTLNLSVAGGLALGTHNASLALQCPGTANATATMPVVVEVVAAVAAPHYRLTRVAGNGQYGSGQDNVLATQSAISWPVGLAVDAAGNVYFSEMNNHRVRRVDPGGILTTFAGQAGKSGSSGDGGPAAAALLDYPEGLAVRDGKLYIADNFNSRIRVVDAAGVISTFTAAGGASSYPSGLSVDPAGQFVVTSGDKVYRLSQAGSAGTLVAGGGSSTADSVAALDAALKGPRSAIADAAGNTFIADTSNHRVRRVDAITRKITTIAGNGLPGFQGDGGPAINASLTRPSGLAFDSEGNLLVADTANGRVRVITAAGIILTIAGNDLGSKEDGGPASARSLFAPMGLARDAQGRIFIADDLAPGVFRLDTPSGAAPRIAAVTSAAGAQNEIAPGAFATIWGENLSGANRDWNSSIQGGRLPVSFGQIAVRINNRECQIHYAGANQVNILVPPGDYSSPATIEVLTGAGRATFGVPIATYSPAFFTNTVDGKPNVAALFGNTAIYVARPGAWSGVTSRPAKAGDVLELYAAGLGPTDPAVPPGVVLTRAYPIADYSKLRVTIGGIDCPVLFAGMTYAGVFQVNVTVPAGLAEGLHAVVLTMNGKASPAGAVLAITP